MRELNNCAPPLLVTTMAPELIAAVLRRGNNRCAWCACALSTGRHADRGVVCRLNGFLGADSKSFVAACFSCAYEFAKWWSFGFAYSFDDAKRILGRHDGLAFGGPFVEYLERACGFVDVFAGRTVDKRKGLLTPFTTALARVEAQRNASLDIRRAA